MSTERDTASSDAIQVIGLTHRYPGFERPALDSFTLCVQPGEFYGLLGPNGAGKTTAIDILCGLIRPDEGEARLFGLQYDRQGDEIRRRIGLVPQEIGLYDKLSARENLLFFGRLHGLNGPGLHRRVLDMLEQAGLVEQADRPAATFSGGMKRRLNLAIGLLHSPALLLLDEPTVGIDAQSRHLIRQQLRALNRAGATILLTTHHMDEAQELCGRIGIIDHGRIIQEDTPTALLARHACRNLEELFLNLTGRELRDV